MVYRCVARTRWPGMALQWRARAKAHTGVLVVGTPTRQQRRFSFRVVVATTTAANIPVGLGVGRTGSAHAPDGCREADCLSVRFPAALALVTGLPRRNLVAGSGAGRHGGAGQCAQARAARAQRAACVGGEGGTWQAGERPGRVLPRRALPGVKFTTRVRGRRQIYYTCNTDCNGKRERECCLLVLNLVSSTLSCIRRPLFTATSRPRPRGWMKGPFIQPIQGPRRHETPFRKRQ